RKSTMAEWAAAAGRCARRRSPRPEELSCAPVLIGRGSLLEEPIVERGVSAGALEACASLLDAVRSDAEDLFVPARPRAEGDPAYRLSVDPKDDAGLRDLHRDLPGARGSQHPRRRGVGCAQHDDEVAPGWRAHQE